jgi:hypothetical protein
MFFSRTAPRDDEHYEGDVAERDPDGGNSSFFQRTRIATDESDYDARLRPRAGAPQHPPDLKSKQLTALGPSIASRALRTVARFSLVVLVGVVATLAWQSYNEEAKELLRTWVPPLGWLLPPSAASTETSSEWGERLKPLAVDLALVRRSVEQLALDQRQLRKHSSGYRDSTSSRTGSQTKHFCGTSAGDGTNPASQTCTNSSAVTGCAVNVKGVWEPKDLAFLRQRPGAHPLPAAASDSGALRSLSRAL